MRIPGLLAAVTALAACGSTERAPDPEAATRGGIGAMVRVESETGALAIDKLATKGGAAMAGVQHYDRIWRIDGEPTKGGSLEALVEKLRGPLKSKVTLLVGPNEADAKEVVVTRAELPEDVLECVGGDCKNGSGSAVDRWGERYDGEFKNGNFNGRGKLVEPTGRAYEGEFVDGAAHGQGVFTSAAGNVFEGVFADGYPQGSVKVTFKNGDVYEGESKEYTMHGRGRMTRPSNGDVWEGDFEWDRMVHGTWLHHPDGGDGRTCVREVKDGELSPTGTISYVPKDPKKRVSFAGAFGDDCVANGEGLMTYAKKKMQGPFANDEPQKGAKVVK